MRTLYQTAEAAERAFYKAFEQGDLHAMMEVWADDASISCVHPLGPTLRGPGAIAESWRQILTPQGNLRFALTNSVVFRNDTLSVHCVHENIHHGTRFEDLSVIIATNVYRFDGSSWRMIVHHASPGRALRPEPAPGGQAMH